jgi:carbon storage regulator
VLVLTRRQGESIVIGQEVVVTVLEVRGGQVRLGVHAPNTVAIHRAEVYDQVVEENRQAVASAQDRTNLPTVPRPSPD